MKFLSSTLTVLLKFIFFSMFLSGVFILSILHTYLDRDYYENYFAEKFVEIQSEHLSGVITSQNEKLPFNLSEEQIDDALQKIFTEENIKEAFGVFFTSIENYDGKTILINLEFFKGKENEFVSELVESGVNSLEPCKTTDIASEAECLPPEVSRSGIRKKATAFLNKNVNFGIPEIIEIETEGTTTDTIFKGLQFILMHKGIVDITLISLMLLPLLGIFLLNIHPFYKGMRKVSTSLISAGGVTVLFKALSVFGVQSLGFNASTRSALEEASVTLTSDKVKDIFEFAFGGMFHIITVVGLFTFGVGILLYVISRVIQSKYEYSN